MSADRGTRLVARACVALLPASLRAEHGDDVVQLIVDRRRHGGEPRWRLWPSIATDVTATAVRSRWEEAMFPIRAVAVGTAFGIASFAALSGAPIPGTVLAVIGLAIAAATGRAHGTFGVVQQAWAPWAIGGILAVAASAAGLAIVANGDPGAFLWIGLMLGLIVGFGAIATSIVLAIDARRHPMVVTP